MKKYLSKKTIPFNIFIQITSLIIALTSMIIAINALNISEKVYVLSSENYLPEIDFEAIEDGLIIYNNSNDLFSIKQVEIFEINNLGFINTNNSTQLRIPIATISYAASINKHHEAKRKLIIEYSAFSDCLLTSTCRFDKAILNKVQNKINNICKEHCMAFSDLNKKYYYLISIEYRDKLNNYRKIHYKYYPAELNEESKKIRISDIEMNDINILKEGALSNLNNFDEQWEYLTNRYTEEF